MDFNLPEDLELIKKKTIFSWKSIVKKKAKEFELRKMMKIKETKNKSKMKELNYEKLEIQEYFKTLDVNQAKTMFRFRTRMAQFDGNFNGNGCISLCPLCGDHSDLQHLCFACPVVLEKVAISQEYESIFGSKISTNLATTIQKIMKIRERE